MADRGETAMFRRRSKNAGPRSRGPAFIRTQKVSVRLPRPAEKNAVPLPGFGVCMA